ncbi:MAG: sugar transferase [Candidatus Electrothrix sp. YB6]
MTADIFQVALAFIAAYYLKKNFPFADGQGLSTEPNYYLVLLVAAVLSSFIFRLTGCYRSYRIQSQFQIHLRTIKAVSGIFVGTILALFLLHENNVSRMLLALFAAILTGFLLLSKSIIYYTLRHYRARSYNTRNILIIGTDRRAERIIRSIQQHKGTGYQLLGCLRPYQDSTGQPERSDAKEKNMRILGSVTALPLILTERIVDEVVFAADIGRIEHVHEYIQFAESIGVNIHIVPDFQLEKIMYQPEIASVSLQDFVGFPTLALSTTSQRQNALLVKEIMDYLVAGSGLILLSPFFLLIMLLIKATSEGPAFFIQQRCGLHGRTFPLIKFRTMVNNAEKLRKTLEQKNEVDGPVFKISNDPRVTRVGRFLRRTSIDELPQLLNVLLGHMSLVGPRPPLPAEVRKYEPWQRRRLSMKPGLTCTWQVNGRNNVTFDRWMRLDLEYIDNWSLRLDIKILLKTMKEVITLHGQ